MSQPLILTLRLNEAAQDFYNDLRKRHFPPERNLIPAHLTIFHQLPDDEFTHRTLKEICRARHVFCLTSPITRSIGRGVAVFFQSEQLVALHAELSVAFEPHLIPQDRQRFQPHIVLQNKVDSNLARHTLQQMRAKLLVEPEVTGLTLWRYLGGPWELVCHVNFGVT